ECAAQAIRDWGTNRTLRRCRVDPRLGERRLRSYRRQRSTLPSALPPRTAWAEWRKLRRRPEGGRRTRRTLIGARAFELLAQETAPRLATGARGRRTGAIGNLRLRASGFEIRSDAFGQIGGSLAQCVASRFAIVLGPRLGSSRPVLFRQ